MSSLTNDWREYCEGRKQLDKSHFLGLFKQELSRNDIAEIFKYFPYADDLTDRMLQVLDSGSMTESVYLLPLTENRGTSEELIELAVKHISEQKKICEKINDTELVEIIDSAKPLYLADRSQFDRMSQQDIPHYWLFEVVGDYMRKYRILNDSSIYALFEAFYGLAADYYLAWYLGSALIKDFIDLSYYFQLWKKGGKYLLSKDTLYVAYV